jgi:hypothetical protein
MARKSNKTSHVLNLLSGADEPDEIAEENAAKDPVADIIKDKLLEELDPVSPPKPAIQIETPVVKVKAEPHALEQDFSYINVMEYIVQDKVEYFNKEFNMCSCSRCITDTTALALTKLPSKYIVVDTSSASPLLNYYTNKYIGQVTVELTKACMIVKDIPHH